MLSSTVDLYVVFLSLTDITRANRSVDGRKSSGEVSPPGQRIYRIASALLPAGVDVADGQSLPR